MDCGHNINEAVKLGHAVYSEGCVVPFMAKFVVYARRFDNEEARLRVFCMTDDKEDKTLEHQERFVEISKSRDVEVKLSFGNREEHYMLVFRFWKEKICTSRWPET